MEDAILADILQFLREPILDDPELGFSEFNNITMDREAARVAA